MRKEIFKWNVMQLLTICCILFVSSLGTMAQNVITISGNVQDANSKDPLIGVTTLEKGTTNGIVTDINGNYKLSVAPTATVQIQCVGYIAQELAAANAGGTILLQEDNQTVDEVVIVGFGTQKKVNLTGSVATATAKDLESRPVSSAVQALQGVIPGLNISNSGHGGELNATKSINIRGNGTVGKNSNNEDYTNG